MKPISVVIPTAAQPAFLTSALESVARQRALAKVEEVLIAENLGDTRSRAVCDRFPQLPIRYVLHEPQLPPVHNYHFVVREARAPLIAFLCDDDWWGPGHLESALTDLTQHDRAIAWCTASYFVTSDAPAQGWVSRPTALWLAAGRPPFTRLWVLPSQRVLATTWLLTPFHFSSMVLRREPAVRAMTAVRDAHPYQADRLFFAEIAADGDMLYDPLPDTYVRWRPDNATNRTVHAEREAVFRQCTAQTWEMSRVRGVDLVSAWHHYLEHAEPAVVHDVGVAFRRAMDATTLQTHGFQRFVLPNRYVRAMGRVVRAGKSAIAWGAR